MAIITTGAHLFLWFVPDRWLFEQGIPIASWLIAFAIGFFVTCLLCWKLGELLRHKRQKERQDTIDLEHQNARRDLLQKRTTWIGVKQQIRKLKKLQEEDKLSPFAEVRLIALEQLCDRYEDFKFRSTRHHCATRDPIFDVSLSCIHRETYNGFAYNGHGGFIGLIELTLILQNVFSDCVKPQQRGDIEPSDIQMECLMAFLKSLHPTEKAIIAHYYYEGMTIPEIAKSFDLSASDVSQMYSSIISRCNSRLREGGLL